MGENQGQEESGRPFIVCLGASAGGLEALETFFGSLSPDSGAIYVVIVHLSPDYKSALPELLARRTSLPVTAAEDGQLLEANHIYIIPPRVNMVLSEGRTVFTEQDREHGVNLPIDIFLESMVREAGNRSLAIILSGTGSDGTRGLRLVKEAGGMIMVQDPATAKFDGMPRSALTLGAADAVDSPEALARRVSRIAKISNGEEEASDEDVMSELSAVLGMLQAPGQPELTHYRKSMVTRRIQRRMMLAGIRNIDAYIDRLKEDLAERRYLRNDLLIGVTSFFRDPAAFEVLRAQFMGSFVSRLDPKEPVRIWVPACSTGQEVYSIAMLCAEHNATNEPRQFHIFATDVHEPALDFASTAVYSLSDVADIPQPMLAKYFSVHESYHTNRTIREMAIFARQDLVRDPPFTRMHLVCCRNFLIYMEPRTQEQVLASLHFSLVKEGMLFLGNSESVSPLDDEFETVNLAARLFRKTSNVVHPALRRRAGGMDPISVVPRPIPRDVIAAKADETARNVLESVLESEQTSCAVLSAEAEVLEVFNDSLGLFRLKKGRPTSDALKIVPKEVGVALTTGLHRLRQGNDKVDYVVAIESAEPVLRANLHLRNLRSEEGESQKLVFTLRRLDDDVNIAVPEQADIDGAESERIYALETDLRHTRETLQATIEELQTTNEEQQSTNEELVAANEELQSTNEELQSVNEELHTVNVELQRKNDDLSVMTADLDNLLENIEVGTLFLDRNMLIRKFTGGVSELISLTVNDVGRPVDNFNCNLSTDFVADVRDVVEKGRRIEKQVSAPGGAWYLMKAVPYRTKLGVNDGVIVTFVDVTGPKNMEELARSINEQLEDANNRLLDQASELEDLFSITAHDLKRPITSIDGLLQLCLRRAGDKLPAKSREYIESAISECARMHRMIRDLGQVSGMTHEEQVLEECDLQDWMDGVIESFREEAESRGIRLNYSCDRGTISLVRTAPEQALRNIIENAIIYGSDADSPRIDVACHLDHSALTLTVTDNGRGIATEHQERVFELFRRLDPDVGDGAGVGLVAARRLLAKVGGNIRLDSEPGKGAKFTISVPVNLRGSKKRGERQRILLVEDDTVDAKTAMRHLGEHYEMTWATNLNEAKELVSDDAYDLLLLDLSLPDGHGLELLTEVRKNLHQDVPIVILTGHSGVVEERALRESTSGYLTKAAAQQQSLLRATVADAIASRRSVGESERAH